MKKMSIVNAVEYCKTHEAVIHTPTKSIYDELMKYLNDKNYKWLSGDKTIDFNGYIDKYTCINCTSINKVTHIPIDYPDADDTEIIELTDNNVLDNFNKGHNNMILYKTINTIKSIFNKKSN